MKESKKQIKAQLTNEIAAKYKSRIDNLESEIKRLTERGFKMQIWNETLVSENIRLKEQLEKYEDWNRRLQEFMDMSEEDRNKYLAELHIQSKINQKMDSFLNFFQHLGLYI